MYITITGTGYVGLVSAAVLANMGHNVTCLDVNEEKIARLKSGDPIIYEAGLAELLAENKERMTFTTDIAAAYKGADVTFICVGTPEKADGSANLQYVYETVDNILANVTGDIVLVVKSTVPIGTNDTIQKYIEEKYTGGFKIEVASNPEFLAQGTAVKNMMYPDRIVIGTEDDHAKETMAKVYETMDCPVVFTDRRSAEMIKYASNCFLAVKISFINEIANLCESLGADVRDVAKGMGFDPRIGDKFLNAGIGYGGSCFPKDTKALASLADDHDCNMRIIKAGINVNETQKLRLVEKSAKYYDSLDGLNVAVLGLTFKPGTDDLREAPSMPNVAEIMGRGAVVKAWDEVGVNNFRKAMSDNPAYDENRITYCATPEDALKGADVCFVFTEWPQVKDLAPEAFLAMAKPVVLDGRNCFDAQAMKAAGVTYDPIGRSVL